MNRSEHTANLDLYTTAQQRSAVSKVFIRHATQSKPVAKKQANSMLAQHNGLLFCVMLAASALIGCLLAY